MRVIGGASRGRRLAAKLPASVRPTSDRVRESIFDILGSQGGVEGQRVIDLFCGSGALGVEALSRGAASATFVDLDPDALAAVQQNLAAVGLADAETTLVRAALPGWLRTPTRAPGGSGGSGGDGGHAYDLALCDPPVRLSRSGPSSSTTFSTPRLMVVLESSSPIALPDTWVVARERRYGGTLVTVAHHRDTAGEAGEDRR